MEKVVAKKKDQRWGIMIAALYGGFALFMIVLVIMASRQHYDLVDSDYYQKGLQYQTRIDESSRTKALSTELTAAMNQRGDSIVVIFPPECVLDSLGGTLHFYRPSNAGWDRKVPIVIAEGGVQSIPTAPFVSGLWRIKVAFEWQGQRYYDEIDFFIPKKS